MNYILFDDIHRKNLYPFTLSRPVCEIRAGILTIKEKWEKILGVSIGYHTEDYLNKKYGRLSCLDETVTYINGSLLPDEAIIAEIKSLPPNTQLVHGNMLLAAKVDAFNPYTNPNELLLTQQESHSNPECLLKPWQIFSQNQRYIAADFGLLTKNRKSAPINSSNTLINPEQIFAEEGAMINCSILNASNGPIYIGAQAEIMEGCMIRGAFSLGAHATLKMGAKIYGATTIGPECKVGGEVNNSVIFGYSNKAHDGFLGNSVIGEWCNLGADTNNSNLKNNYGMIKIWDMALSEFQDTGLQFCGLFMGDHSKAGINTMFNTGTVAGFCSNVFDGGFPPKFIPTFSWGGRKQDPKFELEKAKEVAARVFERRGLSFSEADHVMFDYLYQLN